MSRSLIGSLVMAGLLAFSSGSWAAQRGMSGAIVSDAQAKQHKAEVAKIIKATKMNGSLGETTWQMNYDWYCQGLPGSEAVYVHPDHTYDTSEGPDGTWTKDGKDVVFTFNDYPTVYTGVLSANNQSAQGTMSYNNGEVTGCWTADRL